MHLKHLLAALVLSLGLSLLWPTHALAGSQCDTGSDLLETTRKVLGYQEGAETWDDVNVALGIIPEPIINENVRRVTETTGGALEKLGRLQELCRTLATKDPVEQYFYALEQLFGATPMAPWVSMNVAVGRSIVAHANAIAANSVAQAISGASMAGVRFTLELAQYRRLGWNRSIVGTELRSGNHIRLARVHLRHKQTGTSSTQPLSQGFDSNYPTVIELGAGDDLLAAGLDPDNHHLFFELVFKNGQRLMLPLDARFYNTSYLTVRFPIVMKNGSYLLSK